jgi:hypothetical protein
MEKLTGYAVQRGRHVIQDGDAGNEPPDPQVRRNWPETTSVLEFNVRIL